MTTFQLKALPAAFLALGLSACGGGTVVIRVTIDRDGVKSRMGIDALAITLVGVTPTTTTPPVGFSYGPRR